MSKMEGNDKLEELLGQVLNNTEAARKLAEQMGIDSGAAPDAAKECLSERCRLGRAIES